MASVQKQQPNVDLFDLYFRRADLDRDGRISGAEAVAFFQGSGLPKPVLAQIWAHADHRQTGFLDRAEFYNALKLVTVAQSKRELTPEIVRAALYGPAASKIPAPQINLNLLPAPQPNSSPVVPTSKNNVVTASLPQNPGGTKTNASIMPENILTHDNKIMKPPLPTSSPPLHLAQGFTTQEFPRGGALPGPHPPNPSMTSDWMGGATGGNAVAASSPFQNKVTSPSMSQDGFGLAPSVSTTSLPIRPQPGPGTRPVGPQSNDTKASNVSGNGFAYDSFFGGNSFSATPSQPKQDASSHSSSSSNVPASSAFSPSSVGFQPLATPTAFDSLQSSLMTQVSGGQFQPAQSVGKPNQAVPPQTVPTSSTPGIVRGVEKSSSSQSQMPWPKITQTHVQKYTKVFVEVDTDRDGKITGEQARNLFLSWRLPREVLKQVWDLSDQDNDSMLSLREFCLALYLMERYREGRSLPPALPSEIMFNLSSIIPSTMNYSNVGFQQHRGMPGPGVQQMTHAVAPRPPRPPVPVSIHQADERPPVDKPKPKIPTLEKHLVDQLSTEEQNSLNSKFKEATEADKKVEELEKEILESKQKIEFCRVKMQELILYKSRCDNRLNEIIERASADKREVESLAKKYEEKYKQSGDVASKLSIEEATFRDVQEKKMELYRAIVKMEQDGNAADLQVSVDRIQSDLDELIKSVNDRCKKYGLRAKPTTLLELPFGWQPGIEEGAADWDEDWDKFEDEGYIFVKELTLDVQNVLAPPRQKMKLVKKKEPSTIESPIGASSSNADFKSDKPQSSDERTVENGSEYNKNESDSAKSAPNSPFATSGMGSPSGKFSDSNFGKTIGFDASPRDKDVHSDHWGTGSVFSGDKTFDEPAWGTFDTNDDVDSVWGFNASSSTKDADHERNGDYYLGSNFGLNPIKTGSPQASGLSQNSRPFRFDDSVPSTPLYSLSNSPRRSKEGSEPAFDSFSRFDSFSMHDGFPPSNTLTRFDSMRSTKDFDPSHGFPSFDDSDPFGSSGPFRTSLDGQTPRKTSDNWNAF